MSFRTRLTSFFVLIVVVPMIAVVFLVFRLISDSQQGKADARASGIATAAAGIYVNASSAARFDAQTIAHDTSSLTASALRARLSALVSQAGLARVSVSAQGRELADVGDRSAIAPGVAVVSRRSGGTTLSVTVSELTAGEYVRDLQGRGVAVVVQQASRTLASTLPGTDNQTLPPQGTVKVGAVTYRGVTERFPGFGASRVAVTVLSDLAATSASVSSSRLVAAAFVAAFLLLAFSFSVLASRALQGQVSRFLRAARRLGSGDFSSPIQTEGHDEFAALGEEFNRMSDQLARRLDELSQERARMREAIHRIGQTFASNLDRTALLELALRTAIDAVQASGGRISVRPSADESLAEAIRLGSLTGFEDCVYETEREALRTRALADTTLEEISVAAIALAPLEPGGRPHGLLSVGRRGHPFSDDDREVLRSLAARATLALENVELHFQVRRQAVTDELTGLANHGHFQELLSAEIEQVRRYYYSLGLIMLDLDDFKTVNDTYGHLQGDALLRQVARVVRESSRDVDVPARYGGEEMALILPHTDVEGAYAIAERVRTAIEGLRIPRLDRGGLLRITASVGVAASSDGNKAALLADADNALYEAKRQGKNRTVRARTRTANVSSGE